MTKSLGLLVVQVALLFTTIHVALADEHSDAASCATWRLRESVGEGAWTSAAHTGAGVLPCDHTPVGPPPNPQIGDSWNWYIWRLNGPPVADLRSCTVRGMGANCYVVVEDSQWNVRMNQAQVDTIINHFENASIGPFPNEGIWSLDTAHFGNPPDALDQDPRVYLLYYDFDVTSDGFFWAFDQECDDVAQYRSNECDVVYLNCSGPNPAGSYMIAVLAHEFEHLIHYNYDTDEAAWVDEGLAELAMWLYGDPDNISQFNTAPDRNLTTFTGVWADYIKSYLFSLYFYERLGGDQNAVRTLVEEPGNSIAGYNATLDALLYPDDFENVFADWVVANYLDDTTISDGRFGYAGETLPPFSPFATLSTYPVGPNSASVNHWAADYARFLNGNALQMTFNGADNTKFAVRAMLLDPTTPSEVVDMPLDTLQAGYLPLAQLGSTHDELVMVYAGILNTGGTAYQYGAQTGIVAVPSGALPGAISLAALGSVSDQPTFAFDIPDRLEGSAARLDVFDVAGRLAARLMNARAVAGHHEINWDGRGETAERLATGAYFARLSVGSEAVTTRVMLLR
jgi:hypothetical protein